ncbi:MAG: IscS subfamily cysteine desulfurase [Succinivibrionaceae bacterium]|jgi:cysteine desulfurase|nr:IscS subfamily cysteine desulfurase [Succinivibrionaceae bacterium]MCI6199180.1 IscS subfamily cysteine desulfurase [Pseudomonadota bacterium]MDY3143846.1 IscS subfamily cysteine desulfurase [Succinivibrionaceae bacterium]MDY6374761.1 IscS subfamily cysteine desulfurase [Succinivibrionaceae bacterium]
MRLPVYLDYAATTPVDPAVAAEMAKYLTIDGVFGNPASKSHRYGWEAAEAVDEARNNIAALINADSREIIFTSGASESDNLALKGTALANQGKKKHIIVNALEHKAILDTADFLERQGFEVTRLNPGPSGVFNPEDVEKAIRPDTFLVSIMHVNNEIGSVQDLKALAAVCHKHGVLFHSDAAQSAGKERIDVRDMDIDLMSLSSHKVYGPKGIGAIFIRRMPKVDLVPLIHGGGHERGYRSGTLATHQIVGMGEAFRLAKENFDTEIPRLRALRDRLWAGIQKVGGVRVNGSMEHRVATNLNVSFEGVDGDMLMVSLRNLAVSTGSACTSASVEPSYVLRAIGVSRELAHASIRFSLGRFTTEEEIDYAVGVIQKEVPELRKMPKPF